jgi:hypothetical protein
MARYDSRIATRITPDANARLRLAALVLRKPLSHVLTAVITGQLPEVDVLAERLRDSGMTEAEASS